MKAVILAAGVGKRLATLNPGKPKGLFLFEGRTLAEHLLSRLSELPLEEIIVVGGYQFPLLQETLLKGPWRNLRLIENKEYERGNICTLAAARPTLNDDFILLNSDHLYPRELLQQVLQKVQGVTAICDQHRPLGLDDMKVRWGKERRLTAIGKKLSPYEGGYIGITTLSREAFPLYWDAFDHVLSRTKGQAVVEEVLEELIRRGDPPFARLIDSFSWIEIDTPEDAERARKLVREGLFPL